MKTIVVNLFGAPGAGKSTVMASLFSKLKNSGVNCEMAPEFPKELVWEHREKALEDDIYIFAKQNHRLSRLQDQVDVVITDRPLPVSLLYNQKHKGPACLAELIRNTFQQYQNQNYFVLRQKPYNPNGRIESEMESNARVSELEDLLREENIPFTFIVPDDNTVYGIVDEIVSLIAADGTADDE